MTNKLMLAKSICACLCMLLLAGCDRLNPEESLPVYIEFRNPRVLVDEARQIWSPLGVKDVWLFQQEEQVGVFEMPTVVPMLMKPGLDSIRIGGGVFETGLSGFRSEYPFWDDQKFSVAGLQPLDTLRIEPRFRYLERDSTLIYAFEEDFESASVILESQSISSIFTRINVSSEDRFAGQFAGKVTFTPQEYLFEGTSPVLSLPQSGTNDIWCEVTYKNDIPFSVLLVGQPRGGFETELETNVVFFSPNGWNTAYIHLNDLARALPQGSAFKLLFRASSYDTELMAGRPGFLLLDQIRLIHFK